MNEIKIESGVPMPSRKVGSAGQAKYPFAEMQVGDSIYIEGPRLKVDKVRVAATVWGSRNNGERFASRHDGKGIRIWRVS